MLKVGGLDYTLHAGKRAFLFERVRESEREGERETAGGLLLNPLKHPYIASTSSPNACKWRGM